MFYLDDITNENNGNHHKNWPYISNNSYKMLTIGGSGSEKTNALPDLIKKETKQDSDSLIDTIFLHCKDLLKIKKRQDAGIKHLNDTKAL